LKIRCFEITATDSEMNIFELTDGLQFDDDLSFNKEVQAMLTNLVITIKERHRMLANELDSAQCKFHRKRFFVRCFQKTGTKFAMNLDCSGDYLICDF